MKQQDSSEFHCSSRLGVQHTGVMNIFEAMMNLLHSLVKEVSRKVYEFLSQKKRQKIHPKKDCERGQLGSQCRRQVHLLNRRPDKLKDSQIFSNNPARSPPGEGFSFKLPTFCSFLRNRTYQSTGGLLGQKSGLRGVLLRLRCVIHTTSRLDTPDVSE